MSMSNHIQRYIVQCDPGFVRFDGENFVLRREDDDGNGTLLSMTPEQYADEHPSTVEETFFAQVHLALEQVSGKQFVPSSEMVDILLDLRGTFVEYHNESKERIHRLYTMWREAVMPDAVTSGID